MEVMCHMDGQDCVPCVCGHVAACGSTLTDSMGALPWQLWQLPRLPFHHGFHSFCRSFRGSALWKLPTNGDRVADPLRRSIRVAAVGDTVLALQTLYTQLPPVSIAGITKAGRHPHSQCSLLLISAPAAVSTLDILASRTFVFLFSPAVKLDRSRI